MDQARKEKILIIITGGTIDSRWDGKLDTAVVREHSLLPEYFKNLILYAEVEFQEICMKDSRQLNPRDLRKVWEAVEKSPYTRIIITHGTYTMSDTAKYLEARLTRKDQIIVFTGSMVPLFGFEPSDAAFNLGYALAKVEEFKAGIYLCMNGRTFSPGEVAKSLSEGKFFSVFDKEQ